jgi:hypothetical protein
MTAEEQLQFKELCAVIIGEKDETRNPELVRQLNEMLDGEGIETASWNYSYYVIHLGAEFKVLYMDAESANRWICAGWAAQLYDTNERAQLAMSSWKASDR